MTPLDVTEGVDDDSVSEGIVKRLELFEFEDQSWFPDWIRVRMTCYIVAIHRLLGTAPEIAGLLRRALPHASQPRVVDLCSGGSGPMLEVAAELRAQDEFADVRFTLTDLYPNAAAAAQVNAQDDGVSYALEPVDAAVVHDQPGVRTMICSLHHMSPDTARAILGSAVTAREPFLAFEISDNSAPRALWWLPLPINVFTVLLASLFVRPMTWQQLVFTYLIPILPFLISWDGTVSNARTYCEADLDELLRDVPSPNYTWEKGTIGSGPAKRLYLLGLPGQ